MLFPQYSTRILASNIIVCPLPFSNPCSQTICFGRAISNCFFRNQLGGVFFSLVEKTLPMYTILRHFIVIIDGQNNNLYFLVVPQLFTN